MWVSRNICVGFSCGNNGHFYRDIGLFGVTCKELTEKESCNEVLAVCGCLEIFCGYTCCVGLFCRDIGLFCRNIGLFCTMRRWRYVCVPIYLCRALLRRYRTLMQRCRALLLYLQWADGTGFVRQFQNEAGARRLRWDVVGVWVSQNICVTVATPAPEM